MMQEIYIDIDTPVLAPETEKPLIEIVSGFSWPNGATCVTQESDGEIIWWSCPIEEVIQAWKNSDATYGLLGVLRFSYCVCSDYYSIDDQEFVAKDWKGSIVTFDQFVGLDN